VTLLSTGASIREVNVPDSSGQVDDVVLGHPDLRDYQVSPAVISWNFIAWAFSPNSWHSSVQKLSRP
jgi:hypothetical protein